jgi:hypothetical protein
MMWKRLKNKFFVTNVRKWKSHSAINSQPWTTYRVSRASKSVVIPPLKDELIFKNIVQDMVVRDGMPSVSVISTVDGH